VKSLGKYGKIALIAAAAFGAMAISSGAANAAIVCNQSGDCWHTHHHWAYPGGGFVYHPDDWYFHRHWDNGPYHWRDWHEGRGYYRNGVWIPF
jgi:hypothetical protein